MFEVPTLRLRLRVLPVRRGHPVHVVDPARSRAMAFGRPKTNKRDACCLAELGKKGVLHEVHVIRPGSGQATRPVLSIAKLRRYVGPVKLNKTSWLINGFLIS